MFYPFTLRNGIQKIFQGFSFIHKNKLWFYAFLPLIIAFVLAFLVKLGLVSVSTFLTTHYLTQLLNQYFPFLGSFLTSIPFISGFFNFLLALFFYWIFSFISSILYYVIGAITWGVMAGPFQKKSFLILSYQAPNPNFNSLKWVWVALKDVFFDFLLLIGGFIASFIVGTLPVIGIIAPFLLMVFLSSFLIGRSQMRVASIFYCKDKKHRDFLLKNFKVGFFVGLGLLETLSSYLPFGFVSIVLYFFLWIGASAGAILTLYDTEEKNPIIHKARI